MFCLDQVRAGHLASSSKILTGFCQVREFDQTCQETYRLLTDLVIVWYSSAQIVSFRMSRCDRYLLLHSMVSV